MAATRLPYKMLGGIVPCPGGWLILPARLATVTVIGEEPFVVKTFMEVLEFKPKFDAAAVYAPVGFYDDPRSSFRPCDEEAREIVGWPRRVGNSIQLTSTSMTAAMAKPFSRVGPGTRVNSRP